MALRLLLAAALLVGQLGAQVHVYAHAGGSKPVDPAGLHTLACKLCVSFAPLSSAVGSASRVLPADHGAAVRAPCAASSAAATQSFVLGFRSRAPPVVL